MKCFARQNNDMKWKPHRIKCRTFYKPNSVDERVESKKMLNLVFKDF